MGSRGGHARLLLLTLSLACGLAACGERPSMLSPDLTNDPENNPFPTNYKAETLAFMGTYLNDPAGVHDAFIAEPAVRTIGTKKRYVVCLRYDTKTSSGEYGDAKDRAAVFYVGRFDRLVENAREPCAGANYQPFPELEHLKR